MNLKNKAAVLLMSLFAATSVNALELYDLLNPLAKVDMTSPSWDSVKHKKLKWTNGVSDSGEKIAKSKGNISKIGKADIVYFGARTMVYGLMISVDFSPYKPTSYLNEIKDKRMKIKKIREACSEQSLLEYSEVFRVDIKGKEPLFILSQYSSGASGEGSITHGIINDSNDAQVLFMEECDKGI